MLNIIIKIENGEYNYEIYGESAKQRKRKKLPNNGPNGGTVGTGQER